MSDINGNHTCPSAHELDEVTTDCYCPILKTWASCGGIMEDCEVEKE